jgi:hypothetical protein
MTELVTHVFAQATNYEFFRFDGTQFVRHSSPEGLPPLSFVGDGGSGLSLFEGKALQVALNSGFGASLTIDGAVGKRTLAEVRSAGFESLSDDAFFSILLTGGYLIPETGNYFAPDKAREGEGTMIDIWGRVYRGWFEDPTDMGAANVETYLSDGSYAGRYEGDTWNGLAHGEGLLEFPNGDAYEGRFEWNGMVGPGVYIEADGSRYEAVIQKGEKTTIVSPGRRL